MAVEASWTENAGSRKWPAYRRIPAAARAWSTPTIWQVKAKQLAAATIRKLDVHATERELRTVAETAVKVAAMEYQDGEDRKGVLARIQWWMLAEASGEEREEALQTAAGVLEDLPVPTPQGKDGKGH
jgi:hypothetical protein